MQTQTQERRRTQAEVARPISVAILTGCKDPHYAYGLCTALAEQGVRIRIVGEEEAGPRAAAQIPGIRLLDLRSNRSREHGTLAKTLGWLLYYLRLATYTATVSPKIFHILWNNKLEGFDRTLLMCWYKLFGKRVVLTAHNVNQGRRDGRDHFWNRFTLRWQYRMADHIFVHTQLAKQELCSEFGVAESAVSVIVYGINNAVPESGMDSHEAKRRIRVDQTDRTILFFGGIKPYKGLEYLIAAFKLLPGDRYRLVVAGEPKIDSASYCHQVKSTLDSLENSKSVITHLRFVHDHEAEIFFKAADVIVLPYREIFQSGILFLAYRFGLPAIVTDVGSLRDEVLEGSTGFVCRAEDPAALAETIEKYFSSNLFEELTSRRNTIKAFALDRYSWKQAATDTLQVYGRLHHRQGIHNLFSRAFGTTTDDKQS